MPTLEEERQANIARNAALLREFELQKLGNEAFGDIEAKKAADSKPQKKPSSSSAPQRKAKRAKPPVLSPQPLRKSRRLQGIKEPDVEQLSSTTTTPEVAAPIDEKTRLDAELELSKLVKSGDWEQTMAILDSFNDQKVNISDFYDTIEPTDQAVVDLRREFDALEMDNRSPPALTAERIYSITWHPSNARQVVVAGDKTGQIGLWDLEKPDYDGQIQLNTHTGSIPRLQFDVANPERLYSCSYDGSMRVLDLTSQNSTELFSLGEPRDPIGVSDFHLVDASNVYYTTLLGDFGMVDIRVKANEKNQKESPLSEKKIGGFSVNPSNHQQIATGSLDRTMKVWDVRNLGDPLGVYDSRLSVSCTSWNTANQIVCNGYDNTINIFNEVVEEMEPAVRLKHNCKSGKWVSILKSHWQENPRDQVQKFVIGSMNKYVDIFAGDGQQIAHLEGARTVPAVVALHREQNWVVGGTASGIVFVWGDKVKQENEDIKQEDDPQVKKEPEIKEEPGFRPQKKSSRRR